MKIDGIAHLGYVVPRMQPALRRWLDGGAELLVEPTDDPVQRVSVCLLRADGVTDIELVAPLTEGDSPVTARLRRGGGLDHICYFVEDVGEALRAEQKRGGVVVCKPVYAVAFRSEVGFAMRRTGLVVEFMSRGEVAAP